MNQGTLIGLGLVLLAAGAIFAYWVSQEPPDCAFSGWERSIGVSLSASVADLEAVKGGIGIEDRQVRDYDQLLQDYAIRYDTACRDVEGERISGAHYACIRENMDRAMEEIRRFTNAVEAAKSLQDASTQKQVVLRALEELRRASEAGYARGCAVSLDVSPNPVSFVGRHPERSVVVANSGNVDAHYTVASCPDGFSPIPRSGSIEPGASDVLVLQRTLFQVPSYRPLTLVLRSNTGEQAEVEIDVEEADLNLWRSNAAGLTRNSGLPPSRPGVGSGTGSSGPTLEAALELVGELAPDAPESRQLVYAAATLLESGQLEESSRALARATELDPGIGDQPATLIVEGVVSARLAEPQRALEFFSRAEDASPPDESGVPSSLNLLKGALLAETGRDEEAVSYLLRQGHLARLDERPELFGLSQQLCSEANTDCRYRFQALLHEARDDRM